MGTRELILLVLISTQTLLVSVQSQTNSLDFTALKALKDAWKNIPPSWVGTDPCGSKWDGIGCTNSRITTITLASMGIGGQLTGDIASMVELLTLDLSYNPDMSGPIPPLIGSLKKLTTLILQGCSFSGQIPDTIGSLPQLYTLSLNSNKLTGQIPPSLGSLSNLYWLDLAENSLSGTIPISNATSPGLDQLFSTKHFHFGRNQLSGTIPPQLFNSNMSLIHLLFENNLLSGSIPSTIGLLSHLEVLRLDRNGLSGNVPLNITGLTGVHEFYLSNNQLTGPIPNLGSLVGLNYLDLSNNSFDVSTFPSWYSSLSSLTTLTMENTQLIGQVPSAVFSIPQLQSVVLRNNKLNGTLDVGSGTSNQLQLVDLQNNSIGAFTDRPGIRFQIILSGNPICDGDVKTYCSPPQSGPPYSSPTNNCIPPTCSLADQASSPNCQCSYPYTGNINLRAPSFAGIGNSTIYAILQNSIMSSLNNFGLPVDSVSLSNPTRNIDYLVIKLAVFPSGSDRFNRTGILSIGFALSNQTYKPPPIFGPYLFGASPYKYFEVATASSKLNTGIIIGAVVGGFVLVVLAILAGVYAFRQKKRAEKADKQNNPFAAWNPDKSSGSIPQLKGTKAFTFEQMKKYSSNFSEVNEIGTGGYGKVYRGTLPDGKMVAIKRAMKGSMQGAVEFKSEIELLSRVHHKNVVSLVGFCFDQSEQMLVYEYIANGPLKDSLTGKSGFKLDWMRRLRIALGAARGLQYLHELADPPIIHRDIKSNNILLDDRLNAKVADFGLSKAVGDPDQTHISTQVKGTLGYMDPEYYMTNQLTDKSDVYSFGVTLLELITAKQPIEKGKYIVKEVRQRMDKTKALYDIQEVIDPLLLGTTLKGLERFVEVAMRCVMDTGAERPTMGQIVKEIESIMQLAGINPDYESSSTTTSATYEGTSQPFTHPYGDESLFMYSGVFPPSSLEPK
ncbi:leucine-rich repeat receptor protein kinase HPCA1-like [Impatiens glandulifera]|uniref:leucine-rich repeat receptor protein kinase HPCA1-like n=1 Tax=Impatiens glandulifera TaxID=253017 RepID=UPI001FB1436D|nr:leucine-rich repeat receptor protein kinase HPCA1-like [Impatiens glandulifera]